LTPALEWNRRIGHPAAFQHRRTVALKRRTAGPADEQGRRIAQSALESSGIPSHANAR
jgi:hypothetical protein